ncbi:WD40 repeat-like protein [Aspergillus steynii IBT 23096]|uniref:WD40 repeat-like protein n=1 Tax=Aspergillus steynii IBT 23096 TaxID=1392250 RepID=A0A2I2GD86_9EURO|nr:WD40 repeat-like protein [Aspergillus steynii IBT 23096]PLB50832.1 WD40 repeat-like protein [Aspergillus steynii IBT 23096]
MWIQSFSFDTPAKSKTSENFCLNMACGIFKRVVRRFRRKPSSSGKAAAPQRSTRSLEPPPRKPSNATGFVTESPERSDSTQKANNVTAAQLESQKSPSVNQTNQPSSVDQAINLDVLPPADDAKQDPSSKFTSALWKQALEELRNNAKTEKLLIEFRRALLADGTEESAEGDKEVQSSDSSLSEDEITRQLQNTIKRKLEQISNDSEASKGEYHLNIKDKIIKCVSLIQATENLITAAVSADPHASLAWAGVLVILPIITRTITEKLDAIDGFSRVLQILVRCRVIEEAHFAKEVGPREHKSIAEFDLSTRKNIAQLYARILEYEIRLALYLGKKSFMRFFRDLAASDDWNQILKDIDAKRDETADSLRAEMRVEMKKNEKERKLAAHHRLREIFNSLPFAEGAAFDSKENQHSTCLENTRTDLLEQILSWAHNNDNNEIFWLKGAAGTGKSTIARTVAERLHKRGHLVRSFYFARGRGDRGTGKLLFTSIAKQLAEQDPQALQSICDVYQRGLTDKASSFQWSELIQKPIRKAGESIKRVILIIDALDECAESEITKIISIFTQERKSTPGQTYRIFITSRPKTAIRMSFRQAKSAIFFDLALDQVPDAVIKRDIFLYVDYSMDQIRASSELGNHWPTRDQVSELSQRAGRLFIYAATVCRYLQLAADPEESLERILDTTVSDSSTKYLDEIYTQILMHYLSDGNGDEIGGRIQLFQIIVGAIITLSEPLSPRALAAILGVPKHKVNSTLSPLYSVLDVPGDMESSIKIFHESFRDFLIDQSRCRITHEQAMGVLGLISEAVRSISRLSSSVKAKDSAISKFLYDAYRFVLNNSEIADTAPLQLYSSSLIFAPEASNVRRMFKDQIPAYLKQLPNVEESWSAMLRTIEGHTKTINAIEFSLDGQQLASASDDGTVKLWDTETGALLQTIAILDEDRDLYFRSDCKIPRVSCASFSSDGHMLAFGAHDVKIRLYDTTTGTMLRRLEGHTGFVESVAFSQDNKFILSTGSSEIKCWVTATGELSNTYESNYTPMCVAFSADQEQPSSIIEAAFSRDDLQTIKVFDKCTDKPPLRLHGHTDCVFLAIFSQDHQKLASGGPGTIKVWDAVTGELLHTLTGHANDICSLAFSQDGRWLCSGSVDKTTVVWDVTTGQQVRKFTDGLGVSSVAISPDSTRLAGSISNVIRLWDLAGDMRTTTLEHHIQSTVSTIEIIPNTRKLFSVGWGDLMIWDMTTGALVERLGPFSNESLKVAASPDGRWLAVNLWNEGFKVRDMSQDVFVQIPEDIDSVDSFAFSHDSRQLALSSDGLIILWDIESMETLTYNRFFDVNHIAFSMDGQWLAFCSEKGVVSLWDRATQKVKRDFLIPDDWEVWYGFYRKVDLVFSPDNQQLLWCARGGFSRILDLTTGDMYRIRADGGKVSPNLLFGGRCLRSGHGLFMISAKSEDGAGRAHRAPGQIAVQNPWVVYDQERLLWLPSDYRPWEWIIDGDLLAIGTKSGHIYMMRFDISKLRERNISD